MPRRDAVPLHKNRQAKLIDAIQNFDNQHKRVTTHLGLGTGARNSTICHVHRDWFFYEGDNLYIQIPGEAECRKDSEHNGCGDCRQAGRDHFKVKTEAGEGRIILITNEWTNHAKGGRKGKEEYFGLKDEVESYFALDVPGAPDDPLVQKGYDMIQADGTDGLSTTTANGWLREVAAESTIRSPLRERRLEQELTSGTNRDDDDERPVSEQIRNFGTDDQGNQIPDVMFHDLRACYCTQLMRGDQVPPNKAVNKTGHKDPDTIKPYIMFAANEIDAAEESNWF